MIVLRILSLTVLYGPQWIVLILIVQTIVICFLFRCLKRVWLPYIFFLVFIGGVLVIFVYVSRVTPKLEVKSGLKRFFLIARRRARAATGLVLGRGWKRWRRAGALRGGEESLMKVMISLWSVEVYLWAVIYLLAVFFVTCYLLRAEEGPLRQLIFRSS